MLEHAGLDASEAFDDVGHSADAKEMLEEYRIGVLAAVTQADGASITATTTTTATTAPTTPTTSTPTTIGDMMTLLSVDESTHATTEHATLNTTGTPTPLSASPPPPAPSPPAPTAAPGKAEGISGWVSSFFG